jgi:hypothetical protein
MRTCRETAELLLRLLDMVDAGELDASSAQRARMLRRIEGAALMLEEIAAPAGVFGHPRARRETRD